MPLGHLSSAAARAVAAAASRFGNGIIEATNRANLQIRGIAADHETSLIAALLKAGLGPQRPEVDDIRNLMVSPTAGIDPVQKEDMLPLARDLLAHVQANGGCTALSPKFGILLDGGEGVAAVDHPHDIWVASMEGDGRMAMGFAGSPPTRMEDETRFAIVHRQHAAEAVVAALALFLDEASNDPSVTRFKHLLAKTPRGKFLDRLSARTAAIPCPDGDAREWRRAVPAPLAHVGVRDQRQAGFACIGAVPPLGRFSPPMLEALAAIAEKSGNASLRLTPWQSVIVPFIPREASIGVIRALEDLGLICEPAHPLASIVACSGATGCAAAMSDTKADAVLLARMLESTQRAPRSVHLSGCGKSCASARLADFTLVATAPERYELFCKAADRNSRFGRSVVRDAGVKRIGEIMKKEILPPLEAARGSG
jgi:precorrin-3B synthase